MKLRTVTRIAVAALFSLGSLVQAETKAEFDQRMEWFREARFGMFIHWGLYSVPAGEWKGRKFDSNVEWIQSHAQIPVSDYTPLKDRFNPSKYDPESWVKLAKDAGMKYIVITTKHHEGFCLWDSKQTDWDIASTPYGKDLLKPLAAACARHGIKLCFYHSIMDWHHPQWGNKAAWRGNAGTEKPDMDQYTAYMKAQIKELLTDYGDVGILWFDGEWEDAWTHERGKDLYAWLRELSPKLIINNRVDKGRDGMAGMNKDDKYVGDYGTPEQEIPANGLPGVDWESCMTMNDTWGFSAHDKNWKSTATLVRNLIDIASKGGNYLLNVGPTAEGEIPAASIERLQAMAPWMKANGDAIHGTQASPFPRIPAWGRCTTRPMPGGKTRLYLHVFDWPSDGRLVLSGLTNPALGASLLTQPGQVLVVESDAKGTIIQLPKNAPDPLATVIVLDVNGTPVIEPFTASVGADGVIALPATDATLDGHGLKLEPGEGVANVKAIRMTPALKPKAMIGAYYYDGWAVDGPGWDPVTERMRAEFSEREPVWGWRHDSLETMEQQIDIAADSGVGFFAFCWYWHDNGEAINEKKIREHPLHTGLNLFLKAKNNHRMKFCLLVANHEDFEIKGAANWQRAGEFLMPILTHKQHLAVGGKPLMIVFNPAGGDKDGFAAMQKTAREAGLPGLAIAGCATAPPKMGYTHRTHYNVLPGYDAGSQAHKYAELAAASRAEWKGDPSQPYIPIVTSGWDRRPWEGPAGLNKKPGWYFPDRTPEQFADLLRDAIGWLDKHPGQTTAERLVLVFAWNEFGEGGYIAPTKGDPHGNYLEALRSVVFGTSQSGQPVAPADADAAISPPRAGS